MAGFSRLYVIGGQGGFMGTDGVNPLELFVLVGDGSRQWLEPHYFDATIRPIGRIQTVIPEGPDHPDALLDACIAFCLRYFETCPSMPAVWEALKDETRLDFDLHRDKIPDAWFQLREEARPILGKINIWHAQLQPLRER